MRDNQQNYKRNHYNLPAIDINSDIGQAWGSYVSQQKEESILPYLSSVNIYCGDPVNMSQALKLTKKYPVSIGAGISYPEILGMGRYEMRMDHEDLRAHITSQISTLDNLAQQQNMQINHVRPSGALYQKCLSDKSFTENLAKSVASFSPWLNLIVPASNNLVQLSESSSLRIAGEVHLDRPYRRDGSPRFVHNRINSFDFALGQAKSLIFKGRVIGDNRLLKLSFRTCHINMERDYALELAKAVHEILVKNKRLSYGEDYDAYPFLGRKTSYGENQSLVSYIAERY